MEQKEIQRLCAMNLDGKIAHSKSIIVEALHRFSGDELYTAWTGGKDSTTMLWLFRETCRENGITMPKAMFIDEGSVFEEILKLVNQVKKQWGIDVSFVKNKDVSEKAVNIGDSIAVADLNERNRKEIEKIKFIEKTFAFEPETLVGNHLMKTVAMNVFLEDAGIKGLSTAIRWDEQEARVKEEYFSPRTDPDHTRVHPILHFSERDIWDTIQSYNIPFCSLYHMGYRSLGAKGSTIRNSDLPAWEQDLENTPERSGRGQDKEDVMSQLRALGYM
jgi:phosphoadenosine phosphosulfate reductase